MPARILPIFILLSSLAAWSQQGTPSDPNPPKTPAQASQPAANSSHSLAPPRSDRVNADDLGSDLGDSSSKDTQEDLAPPEDDVKAHPKSSNAVAEAEAGISAGGVSEFHTWDPHRAAKDIEVGDFYFKRKNYRAAQERYREALHFKDDDAIATIKLAISLEKVRRLGRRPRRVPELPKNSAPRPRSRSGSESHRPHQSPTRSRLKALSITLEKSRSS